jgi:hypothetical protein
MRLRHRGPWLQRGIALVTSLLAIVLIMALLAVMVNIGTARLRRTNEEAHALQALAAADSGAAWVRALLAKEYGDLGAVLTDLSNSHSMQTISIDAQTSAEVLVSLQLPGAAKQADHLDINLQGNPQIAESPLQVVSTATIRRAGQIVATRTVTTLLRTFHHVAPYSEIVGVIDDAGPTSVDSPGDVGGQTGAAYVTDLRIQASTESGSGPPVPANHFLSDSWSDGNSGSSGLLP